MAKRANVGLLAIVTVVVAIVALSVGIQSPSESPGEPKTFLIGFGKGSFHINDAGRSHGGFEYAAEYKVEISQACNGTVLTGHIASLVFTLEIGLGDALEVHEFQLRLYYDELRDEITLSSGGTTITLVKVEEDNVWDHKWDGYYIASWGGDAPEEEIRGEISPLIFRLPDHYYVELRLWAEITVVTL